MENTFIYAQIAGLTALIIEITRFQLKSSRSFFYVEPALSSLYTLQFYFLSAYSAVFVSLISIIRGTCGAFLSQKKMSSLIILFFIPCYVTVTYFTYEEMLDLLPMVALLISSCAFIFRENRSLVARLYILNNSIWFVYAFYYMAFAQMIVSMMIISSLTIGIIRHEDYYQKRFELLSNILKAPFAKASL